MNYEEIMEKVKELVKAKAKKNCCSSCSISCDADLKEQYGIDSLGLTELVFDIEDTFGIQFDGSALSFDNLASVEKISEYVFSKM